ncbi:hypothetical protein [Hyphomicrobium facile]|uniref:Uncharacterized protein n=1 Tax=Hyphomicrobium facile TaxID=51670 RepID=A0A1I7NQY2_9HYPH|nr:hypothetical protein [Hyphomicrobium facile]SFV37033.1 hypothetical protein SAMN04488557_2959 [Hyphomicrobium facile]
MDKKVISTVIEQDDEATSEEVKARLRDETQSIIDALTAPAYVAALRAVKAAPVEKRLLEATKRLTPEALRREGVNLPEGMRISSRYFESDLPKPLELGDLPDGRPNPLIKLSVSNPGLLDDLRANNPAALAALLSDSHTNLGNVTELPMVRFGGCHCGGGTLPGIGGTACGGAGYYL